MPTISNNVISSQSIGISPVITKQELTLRVEHLVQNDQLTYLESILQICADIDVDPEDIAKMVTGSLKDKLEAESQRSNVITRTNTASLYD